MKFPVPKTITGANSPIILITWILGIGIVEYPNGRSRRLITAFFSITNFLVNVAFVRVANLSALYGVAGVSNISVFNYIIIVYVCVVFVGITMCLTPARMKVIKGTFKKLSAINGRLKILGIPNDYSWLFKRHVTRLCVCFGFIAIPMGLDFKFLGLTYSSKTSRLCFLCSLHYLMIITLVVDHEFTSVVRYFGNRFRRLNELLMQLDSPTECETMANQRYSNHCLSLRVAEKQSLLYAINETRRTHFHLCKTAMQLNGVFSIPLFLSFILSFSVVTSLSYKMYFTHTHSFYHSKEFDYAVILRVVYVMWILVHLIKMLLVIEACETTIYESKRTRALISELLGTPSCDDDIRNEIKIFLLQLIQNPLNFTAAASGIFRLNYSAFGGVIATTVTYLTIMIQMRSMYESVDPDSTSNSTACVVPTNNTD